MVNAALVLDQSHITLNVSSGGLIAGVWNHTSDGDDQVAGETFTVGISGTLRQMNLELYQNSFNAGDVTLQIVKTLTDGSPSVSAADVLTSVAIPHASVQLGARPPLGQPFPMMSVDLGAGVPASAGDVLGVVLLQTAQTDDLYYWNGDPGPYAGGQAYQANYANPTPLFRPWSEIVSSNSETFGFQTFVDTPEPVTMLSGVSGRCLLGVRRRR